MDNSTERLPAREPNDLARFLVQRMNEGDVEGCVALYTPGGVLDLGGGNVAAGHDAIRQFFTTFLANRPQFTMGDQRPALIQGDLALTSSRLKNGTVTAEVAQRQLDGTWLWVIDQPTIAREAV